MASLSHIVARDPKALRTAASALRAKSRGGDTDVVHVNEREKALLRLISGRAPDGSDDDVNPATGLLEFDDGGNGEGGGESSGGEGPGSSNSNSPAADAGLGETNGIDGGSRDTPGTGDPDGSNTESGFGTHGVGPGSSGTLGSGFADGLANAVESALGLNAENYGLATMVGAINPALGLAVTHGPAVASLAGHAITGGLEGLTGEKASNDAPAGGADQGAANGGSDVGADGRSTADASAPATGQSGSTSATATSTMPATAAAASTLPATAQAHLDTLLQRLGMPMSTSALSRIVARSGRFGDTDAVHVTPRQQAILRAAGGAGTRNPATGLREYYTAADVTQLYQQQLGRTPGQAEVDYWTGQSGAADAGTDTMLNNIRGSQEWQGLQAPQPAPPAAPAPKDYSGAITSTFQSSLGRDPTQDDLNWYGDQLNKNGWSTDDLWKQVNSSAEDDARDRATITNEFKALTGNDPRGADLDFYGRELDRQGYSVDNLRRAIKDSGPKVDPNATLLDAIKNFGNLLTSAGTKTSTGTTGTGTGSTTNTSDTPSSPLANITPLTPVRVPRLRSRRYRGGLAPSFTA
jgi:hypothetical protein